jgi:hypothetical protein
MQTLQTALQNDGSKPALCHTVAWDGSLRENITLELNHPRMPDVPTLFVGNTYVRRNNSRGCIYRANDDGTTGRVRRAMLREVQRGDFTLYFLCEPDGNDHAYLVHVILKPPVTVKVKNRFYSTVKTDGHVAIDDDGEFLLALRHGQHADALLPDGRVVRILCNGTITVEKLPIERQAHIRIAVTKELFKSARHLNGNHVIKTEDYAVHQLISIVEAITPHSETIRVNLARDIRALEKTYGLRPAVAERFVRTMTMTASRRAKATANTAIAAALEAAMQKKNGTK